MEITDQLYSHKTSLPMLLTVWRWQSPLSGSQTNDRFSRVSLRLKAMSRNFNLSYVTAVTFSQELNLKNRFLVGGIIFSGKRRPTPRNTCSIIKYTPKIFISLIKQRDFTSSWEKAIKITIANSRNFFCVMARKLWVSWYLNKKSCIKNKVSEHRWYLKQLKIDKKNIPLIFRSK